jgi:hypothetical protein
MLKMNSTAMVMVRIRRRGLDASRLTLRRTGGRGGETGRFAARAALTGLVVGFVGVGGVAAAAEVAGFAGAGCLRPAPG